MFSWIKNYLAKRKEVKAAQKKAIDEQWKAWFKGYNDWHYGELNVVLDILGMPHSALELCDKCVHLAGRTIDKELMLEMFKLHNIKLPREQQ